MRVKLHNDFFDNERIWHKDDIVTLPDDTVLPASAVRVKGEKEEPVEDKPSAGTALSEVEPEPEIDFSASTLREATKTRKKAK